MEKVFDLAVKTGSYEKAGETKGRYLNVGCVMKNDKGMFILLERTFNPAGCSNPDGKNSVLINMFEPRKTDNANQGQPIKLEDVKWEE